jgi:hypothetical protein
MVPSHAVILGWIGYKSFLVLTSAIHASLGMKEVFLTAAYPVLLGDMLAKGLMNPLLNPIRRECNGGLPQLHLHVLLQLWNQEARTQKDLRLESDSMPIIGSISQLRRNMGEQLNGAVQQNIALHQKLGDAQKHAEKYCNDLKKVDKAVKKEG